MKIKKLCKKKKIIAILAIIVAAFLLAALLLFHVVTLPQPRTVTASSLEKIINTSQLSTFETVYNGVVTVMNEDSPDKVDYYVSYEANIKAGIDFEKVQINVDDEKRIAVTLPPVTLTEPDVDIASLDYLFENDKANTSNISEEAYKRCIADATTESKKQTAIIELAKQNAVNVITALINPFVEQLDPEYTLEFQEETQK